MLGRKTYTREELDHAKKSIDQQLAAFKKLTKAAGKDKATVAALAGDPIRLTVADFQRLAKAFFAELERKFL